MLEKLVRLALGTVQEQPMMSYISYISEYDRYQASTGISAVATYVADIARSYGIEDVSIQYFPADSERHWWSYRAPASWSPLIGKLRVSALDGELLEVNHVEQPLALATYSAATPPGGITARLVNATTDLSSAKVSGAIAVLKGDYAHLQEIIPRLVALGAIGFVSDATSCKDEMGKAEHTGRIELDQRTSIFGFSVTSRELTFISKCVEEDRKAFVNIEVDQSALMPVVMASLPADPDSGEIWLTAHLCHPRPGANDNASGVAALLGVAATYAEIRKKDCSWRRGKGIRFIWGPEFLGLAAVLHQRRLQTKNALPDAAINLDMVGEDQRACGGPFVVERSPDCIKSLINPISDAVVASIFASTGADLGTWRSVPFTGFSDHALFADPNVGRPAVQLCHFPDRFNHSSGDSFDKVSPVEMVRSAASAVVLSRILALGNGIPRRFLESITTEWCAREGTYAQSIARTHATLDSGSWARELLLYTDRRKALMLSLTHNLQGAEVDSCSFASPTLGMIKGRWCGPFNTREMVADMPSTEKQKIEESVRRDKRTLSLLFHFAIKADGTRSRDQIVRETSFEVGRPIEDGLGMQLLDAMLASGWIHEVNH